MKPLVLMRGGGDIASGAVYRSVSYTHLRAHET